MGASVAFHLARAGVRQVRLTFRVTCSWCWIMRKRPLAFRVCSSSFALGLIPDLLSQGTRTIP
jgi:hypothetical protein